MASEAAINGGSAARAAEGVERWNTAAQMDTSSSAQASESVQRPRPESYAQLLSQQYRQTPQSLPSVYSPAYAQAAARPWASQARAMQKPPYLPNVPNVPNVPNLSSWHMQPTQTRMQRTNSLYDDLTDGSLYFSLKSTKRFAVQPIGGESSMGRVAKSILAQTMKKWKKSSSKRDLGGGDVEYVFSIRRYTNLLQAFAAAKLRYAELPEEVVKAISLGQPLGGKEGRQLKKGENLRQSLKDLAPRVPDRLLHRLANFQLEGVRFCLEDPRNGVALIADDMGLGKTIQAIACASAYSNEWPLLVICPTSAKWHWKDEILRWLGKPAPVNGFRDRHAMEADRAAEADPPIAGNGPSNEAQLKPQDASGVPKASAGVLEVNGNDHPDGKAIDSGGLQLAPSDVFVAEGRSCEIPKCQVLILSYTLLASVVERMENFAFNVVIADECHFLKNPDSKRSKAARPLLSRARRRFLLSGTPALSRPMEMFPQLELLRPDIWNDRRAFGKRYCTTRRNGVLQDTKLDDIGGFQGSGNLSELHACLKATVMLRRRKRVILKQLPPKRRFITKVQASCPAMRVLLREYMAYLRESPKMLGMMARRQQKMKERKAREKRRKLNPPESASETWSGETGEDAQWPAVHHESCTCDVGRPASQTGSQGGAQAMSNGSAMSEETPSELDVSRRRLMAFFAETARAKLDRIVERVEACVDDKLGGKFLVFSHHKFVIDFVSRFLRKKIGMDAFIVLDGRTNSRTRHSNIQKFQTDPRCKVGLLSITAAGVGITLTKATHVIFAELFWTPGALLQAEDRAHRIGQTSVVQIEYLVCEDSLDDVLWPLVRGKCRMLGEMIEGEDAEDDLAHQDRAEDQDGNSPAPDSAKEAGDNVEVIDVDAKPSAAGHSGSGTGGFDGVLKELGREAFAEAFKASSAGGSFKADGEADQEDAAEEFEERMAEIEREEEESAEDEESEVGDEEEDSDDDSQVEIIGSRMVSGPSAVNGQVPMHRSASAYGGPHAGQYAHPHMAALAACGGVRVAQAMQGARSEHALQPQPFLPLASSEASGSASAGKPVVFDLVDDDDDDDDDGDDGGDGNGDDNDDQD